MSRRARGVVYGALFWAVCGSVTECRSEAILDFADHLFAQGAYYEAITEYLRFAYLFPDTQEATRAWYRAAEAYGKGGFPEQAEDYFLKAGERAKGQMYVEVQLALASFYVQQEQIDKATGIYTSLLENENTRVIKADLYLRCSLLAMHQFEVKSALGYAHQACELGTEKEKERIYRYIARIEGTAALPYRSPGLAKGISYLVPGGGQIYTGDTKRGFKAMLLNGVLGYVAFTSLADGLYWETVLYYIIVWHRYHFGNALVAAQAAENFNASVRRRYIESLYQTAGY